MQRRQRTPNLSVVVYVLAAAILLATPAIALTGSWSGGGPKAKSIYSITVDAAAANTIYAGSMGSGVFKSTDGGQTWDPSTIGLTNTYVRSVVIYPPNPTVLYAGTNDGVFQSTDAGISWTASLHTTNSVRAFAFSSQGSAALYAGSLGEGIFKTTDLGATWSSMNTGLSDRSIRTIAPHALLASALLAGSGTAGGVNLTNNGGITWSLTSDPDGRGAVYDLKYDPLNASRVYAAMFDKGMAVSTDGGATWLRINSGLLDFNCRALAIADTMRYVGTDSSGVFVSSTHAIGWTQSNLGLGSLLIRSLATSPVSPLTIYAGTDGAGLFKSTDAGQNWIPLNNLLTDTTGRCLLVRNDPAGTLIDGTGFGDGIWTSSDGATTWTRSTGLKTRDSVLDLAEAQDGKDYAAIYAAGVFVSTDGGRQWAITDTLTLGNRFVRSLVTNPFNPQDLIVGTGDGPYRSTNGGASWFAANLGFPPMASVRSLMRIPGSPLTILAGTDSSGVFRSTNGGASWVQSGTGMTEVDIHAFASNLLDSRILFAGTESGLFRSMTGGTIWAPYGVGLPANASIRALIVDPGHPTTMVAGIWEGGVYISFDTGSHWVEWNPGLPDLKVYSLALDSFRRTIYAGTRLRGVFAYTEPVADAPDDPASDAASTVPAIIAGPNPTRGQVDIRFRLPTAGGTRVTVFDARGQTVRVLTDARAEGGDQRLLWDGMDVAGHRVPAGVYWVRLESEAGSTSAKVVVLR